MSIHSRAKLSAGALIAALLAGTAMPAWAQDYSSGGYGGGGYESPEGGDGASAEPEDTSTKAEKRAKKRSEHRQVTVTPYLEVDQVLTADLKNGGDVLTYTALAAGVDASVATRRVEVAASARYERRLAWNKSSGDQDVVSGIARGRVEVANGFNLEAGGLASRSRLDSRGAANGILVGDADNVANVYSVYAGPTVATKVAGLDVGAGYRYGYNKVEVESAAVLPGSAQPVDIFDSSQNHVAWGSIGARPGMLPVGWQVSGGWEREDASQLDQRYDGKYARFDVTLPVNRTLALIGGVGYEDIEISQRDALRDVAGVPLRGPDGRFLTDAASARQLAFEVDGLIWDAGVMWQPNQRLSATAKVGRRYGDTIYTGSLTYRADHATSFQIGVYDGLSSFGRGLSGGLAALPTQFEVARNPLDGGISSCVFGSSGSGCLNPALGAAVAAQYRSRGIQALMSTQSGGWNIGIGAGYDRRRFLAPELAGLFSVNGAVDENYYLTMTVGRALDRRSDISFNGYVNYFDNGLAGAPDVLAAGATAAYTREIFRNLRGQAAVGVNAFDQDGVNNALIGSALLGLRYSF
jgi:hypothetical protein